LPRRNPQGVIVKKLMSPPSGASDRHPAFERPGTHASGKRVSRYLPPAVPERIATLKSPAADGGTKVANDSHRTVVDIRS
jgi:hypothetical protein